MMLEPDRNSFLHWAKAQFHKEQYQQMKQAQDRCTGSPLVAKKRSRWHCHIQRLAGSHQMWYILSFLGEFRTSEEASNLISESGHTEQTKTEEQKALHKTVLRAREDLRLALQCARERRASPGCYLSPKKCTLLRQLNLGVLHDRVNWLTWQTGHGRLRDWSGYGYDLGGSTGGIVRQSLKVWERGK